MKRFPGWLPAILSICLAGLVLLAACGQQPSYRRVSLADEPTGASQNANTPRKAPLRLAVAAVLSPKETLVSYQSLLEYLGSKLNRPVELVQRPTYAEINELIRSGQVDLAFVCGGAFVEGERDFGMELLVIPQVRGQTTYQSYLIVPEDSAAQSLADLRGKVFAFSDPLSNSGRLAPTYLLLRMGERPETFFGKTLYTYSHDNSIKAVADKLVDAAAVDSLVYEYALTRSSQFAARTRVIYRSPPYGIPPVVVHPGLDPGRKEQLRTLLLTLHEDERGRAVLSDLLIDRFLPPDPAAYETIRAMAAEVRR